MIHMKRFILIFILVSISFSTAYADKDNPAFPRGCQPKGYSFNNYLLNLLPDAAGQSQSIYFIHNNTMQTIRLYNMASGNRAYIMHFNNEIKPNQWGVFSTDEKIVKFICANPSRTSVYGNVVNCKNKLRVCEYVNVKYGDNNNGNYWAVNSDSKNGAIRNIIRQGILLR